MLFKKPIIDKKKFTSLEVSSPPLYGLSKEIEYCKICLMSNQRLILKFSYKEKAKSIIKFTNNICDGYLQKKRYRQEKRKRINNLLDK